MKRMTFFSVSIDDINRIDNLITAAQWAKNKICETLTVLETVLESKSCCKKELENVALVLEQATNAGSKALENHE